MKHKQKCMFITVACLMLVLLSACGGSEKESSVPSPTMDVAGTEENAAGETVPEKKAASRTFNTKMYLIGMSDGYDTVSADVYDPLSEQPIVEEWHREFFNDASAPPEMTVTVEGKEYTGVYDSTNMMPRTCYYSDYYDIDGGQFSVKRGESEANSFAITNSDKADKTEEQCLQIANEFAKQYIDPEQYDLETDYKKELGWISYRYTTDFEGIPVNCGLNVAVDLSGNIIIFNDYMNTEWAALREAVGEDELCEMAAYLSSEEVRQQAIETCCAAQKDKENVSCEIKSQSLVCLDKNQLGLITAIELQHDAGNGGGWIDELVEILTVIENE